MQWLSTLGSNMFIMYEDSNADICVCVCVRCAAQGDEQSH